MFIALRFSCLVTRNIVFLLVLLIFPFLVLVYLPVELFCPLVVLLCPFRKQPPQVFYKKAVLKNFTKFTGKHLWQNLFFNKVAGLRPEPCNFIKKGTPAQMYSCEFCEQLRVNASAIRSICLPTRNTVMIIRQSTRSTRNTICRSFIIDRFYL